MFRFEAVAGERFYFQNLLGISNANLRIIGPNGKQTQNPTGVGDREFTAEQTGTYIVLIEGRSWDTAASRDYRFAVHRASRSEEHTSELQSLMRISYAVFCLKKKNK